MNRAHVVLFCVFALSGAATHAADKARALELVLASRADIPLVGLFKEAIRARLSAESKKQEDCYQDIPADAFQKAAVDYFAATLSDEEVTQALAFYATPVGRKFAARNDSSRGQPPGLGLSRQEFEQQEAFSLTKAGNELLAPNGLLQSRQAQEQFEALFASKWKQCGAPPKAR